MTAIQTVSSTLTLSAPAIVLSGKGKAARTSAYMQIAPLSMIDTLGRSDFIANLRVALGASPTVAEVKAAQEETTIGRVAARLPAGEFPKGTTDDSAKLEFARDLVLHYAAPVAEGTKAKALRKGQKGRRSIIQHKVIRAADEAWSQIKAELGLGAAKTQAVKNAQKATRAPSMAGSGKGVAGSATPTHQELVKPATAMTANEACSYVMTQAATLLAFANKKDNAKLLPTDFGLAIQQFKTAINKAANERALRVEAATSAK